MTPAGPWLSYDDARRLLFTADEDFCKNSGPEIERGLGYLRVYDFSDLFQMARMNVRLAAVIAPTGAALRPVQAPMSCGASVLIAYSRTDLYRAVLDRAIGRLTAAVGTRDYTWASIDALLGAAAEDPDGFRLLFQHAAREPEFRQEMDRFHQGMVATARRELARVISDRGWAQWAAQPRWSPSRRCWPGWTPASPTPTRPPTASARPWPASSAPPSRVPRACRRPGWGSFRCCVAVRSGSGWSVVAQVPARPALPPRWSSMVFVYRQGVPMNQLNPARAALLALDFPNYGVHPQDYWATHGEPDWPAIARPAERFIRDLEGNQMGR